LDLRHSPASATANWPKIIDLELRGGRPRTRRHDRVEHQTEAMVAQGSQTTAVHVPDKSEVVVEHLELDDQPTCLQLHDLKPQEAVDAGIGTVAQEVVNELRVENLKVGCGHGEVSKGSAGNSPSGRCVRYAPSGAKT